jgi:K+-sensing histidine kinase KdpD
MSVAVAVDITSPEAGSLIATASMAAQRRGQPCYVISVVSSLRDVDGVERNEVVSRNLELIAARNASPILQEGTDVARTVTAAATLFGVDTLFVGNGRPRLLGRTIAEKILHLAPPFEVVVIGRGRVQNAM